MKFRSEKAVPKISRWRCLCAYDGTEYAGWQKQPSGDSVQNAIEYALGEIFQSSIKTVGAGRTDAGVHAKGQVFHFDWNWKHGEYKLLQALRSKLSNDISPRSIKPVSSEFHVRFQMALSQKIFIVREHHKYEKCSESSKLSEKIIFR